MITHDNDIALVKLAKKAFLNTFVNTLCLPTWGPQIGSRCQIAGWGTTMEHGIASDILMKAEVPLVGREVCSHPEVYGSKITDNMMCAGYARGGIDTCQGDSGGPLHCQSKEDPGRWEIQGVASWGRGCGRQMKYGVYTVVGNYLQWIQCIMEPSSHSEIQVKSKAATTTTVSATMSLLPTRSHFEIKTETRSHMRNSTHTVPETLILSTNRPQEPITPNSSVEPSTKTRIGYSKENHETTVSVVSQVGSTMHNLLGRTTLSTFANRPQEPITSSLSVEPSVKRVTSYCSGSHEAISTVGSQVTTMMHNLRATVMLSTNIHRSQKPIVPTLPIATLAKTVIVYSNEGHEITSWVVSKTSMHKLSGRRTVMLQSRILLSKELQQIVSSGSLETNTSTQQNNGTIWVTETSETVPMTSVERPTSTYRLLETIQFTSANSRNTIPGVYSTVDQIQKSRNPNSTTTENKSPTPSFLSRTKFYARTDDLTQTQTVRRTIFSKSKLLSKTSANSLTVGVLPTTGTDTSSVTLNATSLNANASETIIHPTIVTNNVTSPTLFEVASTLFVSIAPSVSRDHERGTQTKSKNAKSTGTNLMPAEIKTILIPNIFPYIFLVYITSLINWI